ncbi:VOC family protein [Alteribacillus sp. HJP-4]|uniref:VOC family protein n=1 Tax=Alteribacillus sp. HJP-4 TaxID=2775394 RepID=UPI0035CD08F8
MTLHITHLDHIQLAAPEGCEQAARKFYSGILCMKEIEKPDLLKRKGGCWFAFGSLQLHIGVETPFQPAAKAHPAFAATDLHELKKILENHGYPCTADDSIPGVQRFYTKDPFGNRLEFIGK